MTLLDVVAVATGGFIGAILRYLVSKRLNGKSPLPFGTLLVNLLGCLMIGFVMGLGVSTPMTFFLVSGMAGALTTFSTWMKEVLGMVRIHQWGKATSYLIGSILLGILFTYAGFIGSTYLNI